MIPKIQLLLIMAIFVPTAQADEFGRGLHREPLVAETQEGEALSLYEGSYALLIGASEYESWRSLSSIPGELDGLQMVLESQGFEVERLQNPGLGALRTGVRSFIDRYGYEEQNRLIIVFSGHGYTREDKGFLVPVNAPLPDDWPAFRRNVLPMSQVLAWARDIEAKHTLFLFDSCFAGSVFKSRNLPSKRDRYIRRATNRPVRQFITAGSADEVVPAKSAFTPALTDAIAGKGDLNEDGYVTGNELGVYLSQEVPKYVDQTPQFGTIREYELSQGDFVFFPAQNNRVEGRTAGKLELAELLRNGTLDEALWELAQQENTERGYTLYLERFPEGIFAGFAKLKKERLIQKREEQETAERARLEQERLADQQRLREEARKRETEAAAQAAKLKLEAERLEQERLAEVKPFQEEDPQERDEEAIVLAPMPELVSLPDSEAEQQQRELIRLRIHYFN